MRWDAEAGLTSRLHIIKEYLVQLVTVTVLCGVQVVLMQDMLGIENTIGWKRASLYTVALITLAFCCQHKTQQSPENKSGE
jgi:hypothetical protein